MADITAKEVLVEHERGASWELFFDCVLGKDAAEELTTRETLWQK